MARVLLASNGGHVASGYGCQTANLTRQLQSLGHEVAVYAFYGMEGATVEMDGVRVYPKHTNPHGLDVPHLHAQHFGADFVLNLYDVRAWLMIPDRGAEVMSSCRWVPWFPVDCEPLSPLDRDILIRGSFRTIVMSEFGRRMAENAGLDVLYVPHAIDTNEFCPGSKQEARERLQWPQDRFIIGMVAANKGQPSRKCFAEQIAAFAKFKRKHPDALLYLHTLMGEDFAGMNLLGLIESPEIGLKVGRDVFAADQYRLVAGLYPTEEMVDIYRSLDVLTNVSKGEGFGLCVLEAEACGTPVITGDWTAMSELTFGGWKVPKEKAEKHWEPVLAYQYFPRIQAIYEAMLLAYRGADSDRIKQAARAGAVAYHTDTVTERYWKPALADIAEKIEDHKAGRALRVAGPLRAA